MSWLGILLIGFAVTDLTHSVRRTRYLPECVGALVALCVGLLAGLTSGRDVAALLVIAAVVLVWGLTVTWGFGHPGPKAARLPLAVFLAVAGGGDRLLGARPVGRRPARAVAGVAGHRRPEHRLGRPLPAAGGRLRHPALAPATCSSGWC